VSTPASSDAAESVSTGGIRRSLEAILASESFVRSPRLARFLRYTVEQALDGNENALKEYVIGVEVFDRGRDYDPRIDPIVRVEARRLRAKLKRHYDTEGHEDGIAIEFPTGGYVPRFVNRAPGLRSRTGDAVETIAVLPFTNLSSDPENEYFSDGLTQELIDALTKVEGLRVVAWTSAYQFKEKRPGPREIGERLQVRSILEGTVRKSGGVLRVGVRLIHAEGGYYLWSETYERDMQDVFAVQEEISRAIVATLRVRLAGGRSSPLVKRGTTSVEAYNLYLKGRYCWNKRVEPALLQSIEYYGQAITADPLYPQPYAGLADAYTVLGQYGIGPARSLMEKAKTQALRALELDPGLAEAHASLGLVSSLEWDWKDAERRLKRAIELNPGYASAHHWYAYDCLAPLGRLDESLTEIEKARALDPLSLIIAATVGDVLVMQRRYDEALDQFRRAIELDASFPKSYHGAGRAYVEKGMYAEAIAMFEKARDLTAGFPIPLALLAHAYGVSGRKDEARRLLAEFLDMRQREYVCPFVLARIYLGLGQLDETFEMLEQSFEQRDARLIHLKVAPIFDPLRGDPRYESLLDRIGLSDRYSANEVR
jgi:serine/threonine-protein kinase